MRDSLKRAAGWIVPHAFVMARGRRKWMRLVEERDQRLASFARPAVSSRPFDYREAMAILASQGCDERIVAMGSIPEASLDYCSLHLLQRNLPGRPMTGLHIGNYLGISLGYFAELVRRVDDRSVIVSIDPDIPHLGIRDTAGKVVALLSAFGLESHVLMVTGFSLERNISSDGIAISTGYDPLTESARESAAQQQLRHLAHLLVPKIDFAVLDGNHDASYLSRELVLVDRLLVSGGLLILDDVSTQWAGIQSVYEGINPDNYRKVGSDGRVGILQKVGCGADAEDVPESSSDNLWTAEPFS